MNRYWTRSKDSNAEDESAAAAKTLEEMYSGTFTVEVGEFEDSGSSLAQHDISSEDWEVPSVKNLCIEEIAQAIGADNEHLKEIFGGKVPTCLLQQLADHLTSPESLPRTPEAKPKLRKRRMPSLEKMDKISRPPNSFMIFAQDFRPKLSQEHPDYKNKDISVMLGNMWHSLPDLERNAYEAKAREIAAEHKRKNPWYVYNPQEARIRKAQRDQTKLALRAARQRKNSGHVEREGSPPLMMRHPCLPRNGPGMMPPFGAHPHKVFHGSAAAAVSANEMRGHGGPAVHAYGASPPPQRFYPAPYMDHNAYSMQYSSHHQLPAGWFSQQPQYHPQHHHQPGGFGNRSLGRELPYMNSHYLPHHQTPQQHQLLGPNNEPEDVTPMSQHLLTSPYEVEGTLPPTPSSSTPSTEGKKDIEEKKASSVDTENPDSQPLPPFQHAFGSTEIGRFAHEGFSAQLTLVQEAVQIQLEIVEMDGEVSYEGEDFIIECSQPNEISVNQESVKTAEESA
ncbi:transcription factor Sox-9-A-like isoform X1 [Cloeon dipterum]|uniref:transcription factor Sox-9-A-like isoform X1 n=1 Tax=Cloeon dipterum TaxID=197152 RepID=UPI0032206F02